MGEQQPTQAPFFEALSASSVPVEGNNKNFDTEYPYGKDDHALALGVGGPGFVPFPGGDHGGL